MFSFKTPTNSEFWSLEEPARGPGLYLPPDLAWKDEEDYAYLLMKIGTVKKPSLPPASFVQRQPDGPYYQALVKGRYLLPSIRKKRTCICPDCCRRYGISGEKQRQALGMKIRREKQRIRRMREAQDEQHRIHQAMMATSIASSDVERQFKEALKWTYLRGGSLPKDAPSYIRRLAHFRAALKLSAPELPPRVSTMARKIPASEPKGKVVATSQRVTKVRAQNRSARTDEAQSFVGPRAHTQESDELKRMERKALLRQIRTQVLIEKNALRSSNPLDRSLALERLWDAARRDVLASKSRVGDFRFNLQNRLQKAIVAVAPTFDL